ncbi:hypothetical protein [Methylorubrum zatmanii]
MPVYADGANLAQSIRQTLDAAEQAQELDACSAEALRRSLIPFAEFVRNFQPFADPANIRHAGIALAAGVVGHVLMNIRSEVGPAQDVADAISLFQQLLLKSLAAEGLIRLRYDHVGGLN